MPVMWLSPHEIFFPHPDTFDTPDVVAVGGDLSPDRLLLAYSLGIFPWYNEGEPILWWSPDPRMVVFPQELKIHKSMRPLFNKEKFKVTYDTDFQLVMNFCRSNPRKGQDAPSWINDDMIAAYTELHQRGFAHSVEVWENNALVGGLYGLAIGRIFFGESMFARVPNASKFGFISLVEKLKKENFYLIDCQQETSHLASLGGRLIPRAEFHAFIKENDATAKSDFLKNVE
ncbi:MAG: leucyl/phenylalanyl-tRNA--protein transferase [Saprospiraceae bacterium]|nr:leucyl/phenylalanyl-tRNA--protein transferase [Saprospiraceae bacterium]